MESTPREPGSEEYRDSEKYQVRHWDLDRPDSLRGFIAALNRARKTQPALGAGAGLRFFDSENDQLLAYGRRSSDRQSAVIAVVNLDSRFVQSGWVQVDASWLGIGGDAGFEVEDLLTGNVYTWHAGGNFVSLDPGGMPAHLFSVRLPHAAAPEVAA